ncbi:MAG TPA: 16S rRNA (guanine(527)-N(7))-methyltransferase RsmG [Phycisphaerales bacterium]|nr:16S rRNA (guanine(527)-N(7))-methyltransferase RsmG [Phycisphaerales bacterium]HMP37832.1 16S rRNA (guanine(527)-N(7))-methyltransferase RsmG [Phycisphaerales bacterium]
MTAPPSFLAAAEAQGLAFDAGDIERLGRYLDLLYEANARFNLTAILDREQAWTRHILDSLTLMAPLATLEAATVADVGSGGGTPGIPLAISLPQTRFTLIEATGKRARFLESTAAALGLTNVRVLAERSEKVGRDPAHRESFDVAVARAVGPLTVLLELTVPLVRTGGHVLAIKGERAATEIVEAKPALHRLHSAALEPIRTPTGTIVVIEKRRPTPRAYPRSAGEPKRRPLT